MNENKYRNLTWQQLLEQNPTNDDLIYIIINCEGKYKDLAIEQLLKQNPTKIRKKRVGSWNKGKKLSEEHKAKLSEVAKGRIISAETRNKISKANKGRPCTWKAKLSGENSHLWKGGISSLNVQIRSCFEYRQWRSDVFKRDSFICRKCREKKNWIEAHHIKRFHKIIEEYKIKTLEEALKCSRLWDINNGVTLCKKCHKLEHKIRKMNIQLKESLLLIRRHTSTKLSVDMAVEENDEDKDLITGEVLESKNEEYKKGDTIIFGKYSLLTLILQGEKYYVLDVDDVLGTCSYTEK